MRRLIPIVLGVLLLAMALPGTVAAKPTGSGVTTAVTGTTAAER